MKHPMDANTMGIHESPSICPEDFGHAIINQQSKSLQQLYLDHKYHFFLDGRRKIKAKADSFLGILWSKARGGNIAPTGELSGRILGGFGRVAERRVKRRDRAAQEFLLFASLTWSRGQRTLREAAQWLSQQKNEKKSDDDFR